jgi:ion channel
MGFQETDKELTTRTSVLGDGMKGMLKNTLADCKGLLHGTSRVFGRFPSFGYALIYLFMIPIFAFIYDSSADDFYHSTIRHEYDMRNAEFTIISQLADAIVEYFNLEEGIDSVDLGGYRLERMEIPGLRYGLHRENKEEFFFFATLHFTGDDRAVSRNLAKTFFDTKISVSMPSLRPAEDTVVFTITCGEGYRSGTIVNDPNMVKELRIHHRDEFTCRAAFAQEFRERIWDYFRAMEGKPSGIEGSLGRMLYLSAVTITTLGYGDIVPTTTKARFLISTEAILGLVVIGLFLNSLFRETKQ